MERFFFSISKMGFFWSKAANFDRFLTLFGG
jgi:hypothetical protein